MTLTVPNFLSLLRMGLTPLFIIAVVNGEPGKALAIFLLAGITDALDGFVARAFGQKSMLGAYLDPMADKLLLMSAFITLSIPGLHPGVLIPIWVTILVIARDLIIMVVAMVLYLALGVREFAPNLLGKANTALQVATAVLILATGLLPDLSAVATWATWAVGTVTLASGVSYLLYANRLAESASHTDQGPPGHQRPASYGSPGKATEEGGPNT
jgi:cardiolipin synthase (CMP-forming)